MKFKAWAAALAAAWLTACSGGGGGHSTPPITISVTPTTLSLTASINGQGPTATSVLTASDVPSDGLYVLVTASQNNVVSVALNDGAAGENIVVTGNLPQALGVGTFTDTLTVQVCYDQQCARQVSNSPLKIPVTYTVTPADPATLTPTLTTISPSSAVVGTGGFTLVATGTQFAPSSTILWNGQPRTTTYVSSTSISAQIDASDLAVVSTESVSVSNASGGGGISNSLTFTVSAVAPVVTTVSPSTLAAGGSPSVLTVNGSGFDATAQVYWNGNLLATTFVSPTQLTAQVPASLITTPGAFPVTVIDGDVGVASNAISVDVSSLPLSLSAIAPAFVTATGPAYVETIIGTGFDATSTVQWNGSPRPTTFVSTTELKAQVGAADIATVGTASLKVVNAAGSPSTSGARTLTIGAPSNDAVAYQINPQHNGAIRFANIVAPSAFPLASSWTAQLDGAPSYALIAGGRVFATVTRASGGSELVALSAATGAKVWGPVALSGGANATYDNGKVIVLSSSIGSAGVLTAYDAATGTPLWSTALTSQYSFSGPPTAFNGMVYVGGSGSGGTLYAVEEAGGTLVWTASVMNGDNSSPTVTVDGVYVSYPCQTYDFNPLTGALLWNNDTGCEGGGGATGTAANGVYYSPNQPGGYSGMSFDAETGAFRSSYTSGMPPAIDAQTGYFLQGGTLTAIGLSNSVIQWSFSGDGTLQTAPIVVNGYVFVAGASGKLYGLDALTGGVLWTASLGGTFDGNSRVPASGLSAGDGLLVVPVGNALTAYTLSNNP
jgi:outer membrane protein assembly factor BamB